MVFEERQHAETGRQESVTRWAILRNKGTWLEAWCANGAWLFRGLVEKHWLLVGVLNEDCHSEECGATSSGAAGPFE